MSSDQSDSKTDQVRLVSNMQRIMNCICEATLIYGSSSFPFAIGGECQYRVKLIISFYCNIEKIDYLYR